MVGAERFVVMEIVFFGQSCFKIKGKKITIVFDPVKTVTSAKLSADIVIWTKNPNGESFGGIKTPADVKPVVIYAPGEYEIGGTEIIGIAQEKGLTATTSFLAKIDGVTLVNLANLTLKLTQQQLETFAKADILFIPLAGSRNLGEIAAELEAKIIIPADYNHDSQTKLASFLKEIGKQELKPVEKLQISSQNLPEETEVVILKPWQT